MNDFIQRVSKSSIQCQTAIFKRITEAGIPVQQNGKDVSIQMTDISAQMLYTLDMIVNQYDAGLKNKAGKEEKEEEDRILLKKKEFTPLQTNIKKNLKRFITISRQGIKTHHENPISNIEEEEHDDDIEEEEEEEENEDENIDDSLEDQPFSDDENENIVTTTIIDDDTMSGEEEQMTSYFYTDAGIKTTTYTENIIEEVQTNTKEKYLQYLDLYYNKLHKK